MPGEHYSHIEVMALENQTGDHDDWRSDRVPCLAADCRTRRSCFFFPPSQGVWWRWKQRPKIAVQAFLSLCGSRRTQNKRLATAPPHGEAPVGGHTKLSRRRRKSITSGAHGRVHHVGRLRSGRLFGGPEAASFNGLGSGAAGAREGKRGHEVWWAGAMQYWRGWRAGPKAASQSRPADDCYRNQSGHPLRAGGHREFRAGRRGVSSQGRAGKALEIWTAAGDGPRQGEEGRKEWNWAWLRHQRSGKRDRRHCSSVHHRPLVSSREKQQLARPGPRCWCAGTRRA